VAQVADHLVVRDLGSTNGVRINGARAMEGSLKAGDELTIGNLNYRVQWDDELIAAGPPKLQARSIAPIFHSTDDPLPLPESPQDAQAPQAKPARQDPPNSLLQRLNLVPLDPGS
jgi:predicted component of type VI protein secretion system